MPHRLQAALVLDVPEPRPILRRLVASLDGTNVDQSRCVNIYIDPVTMTAMPTPLPLKADWKSVFTGGYARTRLAGYTGLTAANWSEVPRGGAGDWYLQSKGATSEVATTTTGFPANQPMYLSAYIAGYESITEQIVLQCGWGVPGAAGSVEVWLYANGKAVVIKSGLPVGWYDAKDASADAQIIKTLAPKQAIQGKTIDLMLLPSRWNSLLVISGEGGFCHVFNDIPYAVGAQPVITPAASFWWAVPAAAGAACVQHAPVVFSTSATLRSKPITLRYPPAFGAVFDARVLADRIGSIAATATAVASLHDATTLAAFAPNGAATSVRVAVTLSSSLGTAAAGVYAADMVLPATAGSTTGAGAGGLGVDVTCLMRDGIEFVSEPNRPVTISCSSSRLTQMEAAGVAQAQSMGDRTFALRVGGTNIVRGTLDVPQLSYQKVNPADPTRALTASWQGMDRLALANISEYETALAYDNLQFSVAISTIWGDLGFADPADIRFVGANFRLPFFPACSRGEWLLMQERGDTRGKWLDKLFGTYASNWIHGWMVTGDNPASVAPAYKFNTVDYASLSTTPLIALYERRSDATTAKPGEEHFYTVRNMQIEQVLPAANQIIVLGYVNRSGAIIRAQWDDAASQSVTTAPAARPAGWRGQVVSKSFEYGGINDQATADRLLAILVARLGVVRTFATWSADLLTLDAGGATQPRPIWRGDVVRIWSNVTTTAKRGDFRIQRLSGKLLKNVDNMRPVWDCSYRAELVAL